MSNPFLDIASAIGNTDDSLRNSYIKNGISTIYWAFHLMNLQAAWQGTLTADTNDAAWWAVQENGAGKAATFKAQYEIDTQEKDSQCNVWQSLIQAGQVEINNDSDGRKGNFKLADGLAATTSFCNSLLVNF